MKNMLLASTSTVYGSDYLEYLFDDLSSFFSNANEILFIPYARPSGITHNVYTEKAEEAFNKLNKTVRGIHEFTNPKLAIEHAKAIFVGGGNTFVLLDQLYKNNLMPVLSEVLNAGTPYLGSSAGTNICGLTIQTTNDMPIVYPPSFNALGLVPFNINPHYLDSERTSKHMGETRETRIKEFHAFNTQPVIGLREGSWLQVYDKSIILKGKLTARIFEFDKTPYELESGLELSNLK